MITGDDVTVVIPSLPERWKWLERAVGSVSRQSAAPAETVVHVDEHHEGAHVARNAALKRVSTPWVAFLDDDDMFHPDHLETLIAGANKTGADLISSYPKPGHPRMVDALVCCYKGNPVTGPINIPWGPEQIDHLDSRRAAKCQHCGTPRGSYIMNTNLVRMELVDQVGGYPAPFSLGDDFSGCGAEEYLFLLRLLDAGALFHHVTGCRTWTYR